MRLDEPIGDPGLVGKGNPFLGGQDAVDCPEFEAGGQDAPQGCCGAESLSARAVAWDSGSLALR